MFLFVSTAILSGYKSEGSSSGCNSPPEIIVSKPVENDNIENSPVSVEFTAIQNSTDFTSIDLGKVSAIIRDNMNKVVNISQYIASSCDFLKKNCSFKGEVNLSEGEYILEVKVCNTEEDCSIKKTRFYFSSGSIEKNIYHNYSPNTNYKLQIQVNPYFFAGPVFVPWENNNIYGFRLTGIEYK